MGRLEPTGAPASIAHGLDNGGAFSDACVRLEPTEVPPAGIPLLPPALAGGAALEPSLLVVSEVGPEVMPCAPPGLAFGPACGTVADDRVQLHATAPAFVAFETPTTLLGVVDSGVSLVLRGFEPSSVTRVRGVAFDARGVGPESM